LKILYYFQPKTSFGVMPHHQLCVGNESPILETDSLISMWKFETPFPPEKSRLIGQQRSRFSNHITVQKSHGHPTSPHHQCSARQPPVNTQWVSPNRFVSLVIDFGRCIFKLNVKFQAINLRILWTRNQIFASKVCLLCRQKSVSECRQLFFNKLLLTIDVWRVKLML